MGNRKEMPKTGIKTFMRWEFKVFKVVVNLMGIHAYLGH